MEEEFWTNVRGYPDYAISTYGSVENMVTCKILKPQVGTTGYYHVTLYNNGKFKKFKIHKLVANAYLENLNNKENVDHIDCDRLNNNVSNLRWCTSQENSRNAKLSSKSSSGFKGICFHKQSNKWRAHIMIDGIQIHLGLFDNIEDAKYARQEKVNELFGEYTNACEKI